MNQLTLEQRHAVYQDALTLILDAKQSFMCVAIQDAFFQIHGYYLRDPALFLLFPEFESLKPSQTYQNDVWFSLGFRGRQQRIDVLKKCVELTNPLTLNL